LACSNGTLDDRCYTPLVNHTIKRAANIPTPDATFRQWR
jgi:hypothetical protein